MNMILGRKSGMTRIFKEDGNSIPVTVIEVNPNRVVMVKTKEGKDGYNAVQVTAGQVKEKKLTKSEKGHFAAAKVEAGCKVLEFPVTDTSNYKVGDEIKADIFKEGNLVDVIATSRGKGFAGTIKRHNFRGQRQTHGNSLSHRVPGSIGQCQDPGKVFKGKKMAGHMGNRKVTVQNLEIIKIDQSKGVILIKGAVPGAPGSDVVVKSSVKKEGAA